jgi:hypothetical protein
MFSQYWFETLGGKKNFNCLRNIFDENKPINFLEIGCFEGNCHLWMYKNLLKNKLSKSTVIDPFGDGTGNSLHSDVYEIFKNNLNEYLDNITILRTISNNAVSILNDNEFDIIYIDGDHTAEQTYLDAKMCWSKLKKGGVMAFDDYLWHDAKILGVPNIPKLMAIGEEQHPALGINKFLEEKNGEYKLLGKEYGFDPECKILDLERINIDLEYARNMRLNYNYQIFILKT